jgi:hypothetical protein
VAVLLDMSWVALGCGFPLRHISALTQGFIDTLRPGDRVRLGSFGDEVALSPLLSSDKTVLARILREEFWPNGARPLWTAIDRGMASLSAEPGRRVILTMSFGSNNCRGFAGTCVPLADVERQAVNQNYMVYAIAFDPGFGIPGGPSQPLMADRSGLDAGLRRLVQRTGGGHVQLKEEHELLPALARVTDELHGQYLLGLTPASADNAIHTLVVRTRRAGLTVRARESYLAVAGPR